FAPPDVSEPPPPRAAVPNPPDSSPQLRLFLFPPPFLSVSPLSLCSCENSPRSESLFAKPRFVSRAALVFSTTGPHRPSPQSISQATQSSADSAHLARTHEPSSLHQFRSASEICSASAQTRPVRVQFPTHKYLRCTNTPTNLRPEPESSGQSRRDQNRQFQMAFPGP